MTDGTVTPPPETQMVTGWFGLAWVPAGGSCLVTVPDGCVEVVSDWTWTFSPSFSRAFVALFWVWPTTFGTEIVPWPLETKIVTVVVCGTAWPFDGLVLITVSLATV